MEDYATFESIVANSNLVATAGEFVPKSLSNLQPVGVDQLQNDYVFSDSGACRSFSFQEPRKYNEPDGCAKENCSNLTHTKKLSATPALGMSAEVGESSTPALPAAKSLHKKSNLYLSCPDYRFSKYSQKKHNKKCLRSALGESQNLSDQPLYGTDLGRQVVSQNRKKNFRMNQRVRLTDDNQECSGRVHFPEGNSATYVRPNNQHNNYFENKNLSWRYKEKFRKIEQQKTAFPKFTQKQIAKGIITVESDDTNVNSNRVNESCKIRNLNVHKESYKTFGAEDFGGKYKVSKNKHAKKQTTNFDIAQVTSQREQLIDMLARGILECLVCCDVIYQSSSIWSCYNCYHVLHLKCIIKWAKSSKSDYGWRCPACQNVTNEIPDSYYCFCGKTRDPEWNHQDCPHSCGEVCGKSYRKSCPHKCNLLCHPGPCPQCTATITKSCGCQKTTKTVQCFSSEDVVCNEICGKELNCLIHTCSKLCHVGGCDECHETVSQVCFCQKKHREVRCTIEVIGCSNFSCGDFCQKKLTCGNHICPLVCHEGQCPNCESMPEVVKFCPCGQTELASLIVEKRTSCTDSIPTCDSICGKVLACSSPENPHTCKAKCHVGPCPDCTLEKVVKCRCGHKVKKVPCRQLKTMSGEILCEKKCSKKRSCGKHKCNQVCCTAVDHECPLPCNRFLQCGLHRCEETCHRGHCKPCLQASFEELSCECGAQVIFPPVPCGSRRPACDRPCTRVHSCDHVPVHNCHSANQCPPCTILTKKYCHGRHELRRAVPCHQESFSCGLPCGKELECGRHKCILPCHPGNCLKQDQTCVQPCTVLRLGCGHICGTPCHEGQCPTDVPCKEVVRVTCECGHRFTTRGCHDNAKEFHRITTAKLATKMADLQAGQSVDLNVYNSNKKMSYKTLECNDECKLIERNRRLAIALQIRNPDLSAKLTPRYSEYLKNWAKRDPRFCQMIHDKLTDLVQLAKQSKQKSRSYSFDPMNREKRHFIHEYCDHFGCESVAYDQEPKRNVVATALKDKSWLPSVSIVEFIQKENSPRKVPAPITAKSVSTTSHRVMEVLPNKFLSGSQQFDTGDGSATPAGVASESQFDYFDWRPQNI